MWLGHLPEPLSPSCHDSWQLLQSFEDIPLCSILQQIQEKHNLQKVKKVRVSGPREVSSPRVGNSRALGEFTGSPVPGILFQAMMRPALFANLFGVLALFQSGRLVKVRALGAQEVCGLAWEWWGTVACPAHTLSPFVGTRTQKH